MGDEGMWKKSESVYLNIISLISIHVLCFFFSYDFRYSWSLLCEINHLYSSLIERLLVVT